MKVKREITEAGSLLGIEKLKNEQIKCIKRVLNRKDTLAILPVGYGKSAIMQIPAIIGGNHPTIVFEPTISLMSDQVRHLRDLGICAEYISSRNRKAHKDILNAYARGDVTILYVAPERLDSEKFQRAVCQNPPWLVVVDEAHCALEWGMTFRPDYLRIGEFIDSIRKRPTVLALTATAPKEYREELQDLLHMEDAEIVTTSLARKNLTFLCEHMQSAKYEKRFRRVATLIRKHGEGGGKIVVYCAVQNDAAKLYRCLEDEFPGEVAECFSFLDDDEREKHEEKFIQGKRRIMVATTAFGLGIDVPDIRLIIHMSMPISPISFYQEAGRAGRDGNPSRCVLLYHPDDEKRFAPILKAEEREDVRKQLKRGIKEMKEIAEGDKCIMQALLEHLDDTDPKPCGRCSVCQRKRGRTGK